MVTRNYRTTGRAGYNVKFSPFRPNRLACSTCELYGISGEGTLFVFDQASGGSLRLTSESHWKEGLYDVTWSEIDENIAITGSTNGSIQFWNIIKSQNPVAVLHEHTNVTSSLDWSQTRSERYLLSGSWDHTAKVWDTERGLSLSTYSGHGNHVNCVSWAPFLPGYFASVSGNGMLRIWNIKQPSYPTCQVVAHLGDALGCDWCKYNSNMLVTSGADSLIRGWDIRNISHPVFQLVGHEYGIRRIKFSPHEESLLCSVSYDLTTRVWDWKSPQPLQTFQHHTEFVYGVDFNTHVPNEVADCGFDGVVQLFYIPSCNK